MCLVFANYVAQTIDGYIAEKHHHKTTEAQLLLGDIEIDNLYANIMDLAEQNAFTTPEGHKYVPKNQTYRSSNTPKRWKIYHRKSDEEREDEVIQDQQHEEFYDFTLADKIEDNFIDQTPQKMSQIRELFGTSDEENTRKVRSVAAAPAPLVIVVNGSSSKSNSSDDDNDDDDGDDDDNNNNNNDNDNDSNGLTDDDDPAVYM